MNNRINSSQINFFSQGFTLVEMAMVLAIVTLLLTGLVPTISGQLEQRRSAETKKQLDEIQQALIGFAIINGHLPCPATLASNGLENRSGGFCNGSDAANYDGYIPGATLGLSYLDGRGLVLDAWDNPIRYAVTGWNKTTSPVQADVYTTANGMATVGLSSLSPSLLVCNTATGIGTGCASGEALTADPGVPAVVFSTGKNGASGGTGTDESENLNADKFFVSHTPTATGNPNGEFDDLVIWISNQVLISKMVSAGKLP